MRPTTLLTVTMVHLAFCVPTPWMAGDKILPLLNKDAPSSQDPKADNDKPFVLAASHRAPGPIAQKPGQSFSTIWEKWKKQQHDSAKSAKTVPKVANSRKDIPVLIITEMGELSVGIPSSSQKSSSKETAPSTGKQKVVSAPLSAGKPDNSKKADNVSVTELGELSVGIPSSSSSSSASSSVQPSASRPSTNSTLSPCPFYNVGNTGSRDHDDVLIIGLISTFLLVVVVVEAWGPVWRSVRNRLSSRRKGAIRLAEGETETKTKPKSFRSDSS